MLRFLAVMHLSWVFSFAACGQSPPDDTFSQHWRGGETETSGGEAVTDDLPVPQDDPPGFGDKHLDEDELIALNARTDNPEYLNISAPAKLEAAVVAGAKEILIAGLGDLETAGSRTHVAQRHVLAALQSDVVVVARVDERDVVKLQDMVWAQQMSMSVLEVVSGTGVPQHLEVAIPADDPGIDAVVVCGAPKVTVGATYLFYLRQQDGKWLANGEFPLVRLGENGKVGLGVTVTPAVFASALAVAMEEVEP